MKHNYSHSKNINVCNKIFIIIHKLFLIRRHHNHYGDIRAASVSVCHVEVLSFDWCYLWCCRFAYFFRLQFPLDRFAANFLIESWCFWASFCGCAKFVLLMFFGLFGSRFAALLALNLVLWFRIVRAVRRWRTFLTVDALQAWYRT